MKPQLKDWSLWQRNVLDKYKSIPTEDIKADLAKRTLPAIVLLTRLEGDFNIGSVIRSANNFNLRKVFYYGKKHIDKRAMVGVHNYIDVIHLPTIDEVKNLKEQYTFIALENNIEKKVINIKDFQWQKNTCIVVGEENMGIAPDILELCDHFVEIPSMGSVRSLNAASAASIAMYDMMCKIG